MDANVARSSRSSTTGRARLPKDRPIGTKGGMCLSFTLTRLISAPSRDRSVATPRPRLGTRFGLVNDRATARLIPSLEPASLSGARLRKAYGAAGSRPTIFGGPALRCALQKKLGTDLLDHDD